MRRTVAGDSSICLRSVRPSVSVGVARPTLRARTVARASARIPQGRATSSRPCPGGSTMPPAAPTFVGIDVAKTELVIRIRPSGDRWTVVNDGAGVQALVKRLDRHAPALVVLEATGGYEPNRKRSFVATMTQCVRLNGPVLGKTRTRRPT